MLEKDRIRGARVRAWRIKALFSRVAGNQQELDMSRLLTGLEIGGSILSLSAPLEGTPRGERMPSGLLQSRHIHPQPSHLLLHIPHIPSLLACPSSSHSAYFSLRLIMISHFASRERSNMRLGLLPCTEHGGNEQKKRGEGEFAVLATKKWTLFGFFQQRDHSDLRLCMFPSGLQRAAVRGNNFLSSAVKAPHC